MKKLLTASAALLMSSAPLFAGGIERWNQSIGLIFEEGNYAEFSFGLVKPSIDGRDRAPAVAGGPYSTGSVAEDYSTFALGYKHQFNKNLSGAIIFDHPYGADISYPTAANGGSLLLGGTQATVDSTNIVGVLRYKMDNGFGVHGGIRSSRASADVTLAGAAYGPYSGYSASLDTSTAYGWLAGASYERPDIALRVALTYNSPVTHKFDTVETGGPLGAARLSGETEVTTPRAWNLDVQTGVAADTLVFGGIRWVKWSEFKVAPPRYSNFPDGTGGTLGSLVDLEDTTTYTLGVGRKFSDQWSGAASVSWEPKGDDLVSPLAPTNGRVGMTLAAIYTMDNMKITTGINYTKLGDANPETAGTARADMTGNSGLGIGVKIGMSF